MLKWNKKSTGIYVIKNKINGKVYVGKSISLYRRKYQHFQKLKTNKHQNQYLQNSVNKYGIHNFEYIVLEVCDISILNIREYFWINEYKSYLRINGYNIDLLDENGKTIKSYEAINKLKKTKKNNKYQKPKGKDNPTSKEVHQYSLDGNYIQSFESCHIAAIMLGNKKSYTTISKIARKEYGTSLGFQWRYFKVEKIKKCKILEKVTTVLENNSKMQRMPIIGIDLSTMEETEYESMLDASKKLNLNVACIMRIINGERKKSTKLNMTFKKNN